MKDRDLLCFYQNFKGLKNLYFFFGFQLSFPLQILRLFLYGNMQIFLKQTVIKGMYLKRDQFTQSLVTCSWGNRLRELEYCLVLSSGSRSTIDACRLSKNKTFCYTHSLLLQSEGISENSFRTFFLDKICIVVHTSV